VEAASEERVLVEGPVEGGCVCCWWVSLEGCARVVVSVSISVGLRMVVVSVVVVGGETEVVVIGWSQLWVLSCC
jgi:hypothetical protein